MTATTKAAGNRSVKDTEGSVYELRGELSRGGRVSFTTLSIPKF